MKVFAVMTVARQIEGEYVFIKTEKGFAASEKADALMTQLKSQYTTPDGKAAAVNLKTPHGDIPCHCAIGVFELEIEE